MITIIRPSNSKRAINLTLCESLIAGFLLGLLALSDLGHATSSVSSAKQAIVGTWEIQYPTDWNPAFNAIEKESYHADGTVTGTYTLQRNSGTRAVVYQIIWKSRYILEKSRPDLNAVEIRFEGISKAVKLETRDALLLLEAGISNCGLKPNFVTDLARHECLPVFRSLASCPTQYNSVSASTGMLRFGEVANEYDTCAPAGRPTKLTAIGPTRIRK